MIQPLDDRHPVIGREVFVAPTATVVGDVELGDHVTVFFGAVLRGDILPIRVGKRTNIQEHALLHTSHGRTPTILGEGVTIGHGAIVHGCTVADCSLIGMGSTI
ncbi:MAG: gamma carbonic anhydrase family protein, partial [Bdellovibrionales bacterium]|nr:gamma carbonic anhydrase family protein [Bdellovibrionales bacterium]